MEFLTQSWGYIAAAIGIITLLWNFKKLLKDIKDDITAPFTRMDTKIDDLTNSLNDKIDNMSGEINNRIDNLSDDMNKKVDKLQIKIDAAEKSDQQVRGALLTMQRNSLLRSCEDFIGRGFATMNEKETISSQYDSYHELGGDSFVTDLVKTVIDLPLKKQTETDK